MLSRASCIPKKIMCIIGNAYALLFFLLTTLLIDGSIDVDVCAILFEKERINEWKVVLLPLLLLLLLSVPVAVDDECSC